MKIHLIISAIAVIFFLCGCRSYRIDQSQPVKETLVNRYEKKNKNKKCTVSFIVKDSLGNGVYVVGIGSPLNSILTVVANGKVYEYKRYGSYYKRKSIYRLCKRKLSKYISEERMTFLRDWLLENRTF